MTRRQAFESTLYPGQKKFSVIDTKTDWNGKPLKKIAWTAYNDETGELINVLFPTKKSIFEFIEACGWIAVDENIYSPNGQPC